MKKPRLLNLAAGVSLLLAIAIVALWVRSHWRYEAVYRSWQTATEQRYWAVESEHSSLVLVAMHCPDKTLPIAPGYHYWDMAPDGRAARPSQPLFPFPPIRFEELVSAAPHPSNMGALSLAYWLLLLPTLPLPLIAFVRHRRRRRRETNNLCSTCGYDLRATPDRCPECGAVPASKASRAAT